MTANHEFKIGVSDQISDSISNANLGLGTDINLGQEELNKPTFDAQNLASKVLEKKEQNKKDLEKKDLEKKDALKNASAKNDNKEAGGLSSIIDSLTSFFTNDSNDKDRLERLKQQSRQQNTQLQDVESHIDVAQFEAIHNSKVPHSDILKAKARTKESQFNADKTKLNTKQQAVNDEISNLKSKGVKL